MGEVTDLQKRGRVALLDTPSGYRVIANRTQAPPEVQMEVELFQFTAMQSMKKCPNNSKNQERIYVEGDTVGVVMNFDPFNYTGEVWFIVTKQKKHNKRRLWRRRWTEIQENFGTNLPSIKTECFDVCELGKVSVQARNGRCVSTRETGCLSIRIDEGIFLWVEVGMFKLRTLPQNMYFTKMCMEYSNVTVIPKICEKSDDDKCSEKTKINFSKEVEVEEEEEDRMREKSEGGCECKRKYNVVMFHTENDCSDGSEAKKTEKFKNTVTTTHFRDEKI